MTAVKTISETDRTLVLGRITSVFGIKGWVKVYSYTQPIENVLQYKHWTLNLNGQHRRVEITNGRKQGPGLVAHIKGVDDRNEAMKISGAEILLPATQLPQLEEDEFYWYQLEGLEVISRDNTGNDAHLGKVSHLMETGSNDVLVVRGTPQSIDRRERLIPYLPDQVVTEVNLEKGFVRVEWDPEF